MDRLGLKAGLAIIVLVTTTAIAADQHVMVQPDDLKWASAPPVLPKGAQIAVLYGDPDKADGTMYLGMGDKFGAARGDGLKAAASRGAR